MGKMWMFSVGRISVVIEQDRQWSKPLSWGWPAVERGGSSVPGDYVLWLGPYEISTEWLAKDWRQVKKREAHWQAELAAAEAVI